MAIKTYPLNDTDYQAEDAELFHCTRTSGVYASGHFPVSVTGTDNNITIGKGIGWLKNTEFSGKVFASKEEITLNAGVPDASLPRVDAVVVRFDANQNETYFTIKQGSVGSPPTPPEVERGEYIYELHLYHIRRRPGATAITPGDITDLRMDANYCGLMADSVTRVDMSAINAQIREFISDWENQIANVTDGKMIESPEYPGCYYRMNRGVKEWLNPPMMEDVEYATTKRQDGKRVYTKLLKARSQTGSVSLPDIERIVSVFAVAERDWNGEKLMFQIPVDFLPEDAPTIQKMQIYYQGNTIVFQSAVTKGTYNLYITVSYTKPGDEVAYTNVTADGDTVNVETSGDVSAQGDNLNVEMFTTVSADGGAYIRRLNINGVAYDLAVGQAGSGVPGTAYPGVPGQFYTDLDSGEVYVCVGGSADAGVYIWRTIIPTNLPVTTLQINHKTGIGSATINASQGAVLVQNNGQDAIIHGVAKPVQANDVANKQYVDNLAFSGGNGTIVSGVASVNGKTGDVVLSASDVGAMPNTYTPPDQTAEQVGADPAGTALTVVGEHNVDPDSHNDIRLEVKAIREQLSAFLDVDEETLNELSELIAAIAANQTSIAQLTSGKVNVSEIVDNLTTNVANRPLSAAQGVALKALFDKVPAWALAADKPGYSKSEVGLSNVDNVRQYSASNPPPYPVTSVNGKTGAVTVDVPTKVSQLTNDSKFISSVTAAMVTAALGYTPINPGKATLGRHTDGLLYLFVDGKPVGSGVELPTGGIDGYITEDKQIVFNNLPDGEYTLAYLMEDGSVVTIGELVKDTNTYYSITNNLTNCVSSNSATQVTEGESYSATITAKSGYELKTVTVTMGGSPVTVSGGTISIANVTGNIVITAVAEEKVVTPSYTNLADPTSADWAVGKRLDGSGNLKDVDAGVNGATTNYIGGGVGGFAVGDVIRVKGMDLTTYRTIVYNNSKVAQSIATLSGQTTYFSDISVDSKGATFKIKSVMPSDGYIRFCGPLTSTSADVIITKNEEIA